ncbi:MAG: sensor histidine kinase RegB [Qingshengfaniella sp.]
MDDPFLDPFNPQARSHWIRLRTLIVLRWIAIIGQVAAITVAGRFFDIALNLPLCYLAVGVSTLANTLAMFAFPAIKRLTEHQVVAMLLFDISQLCFLLYLTGGLSNPFALLILAPVTISASALNLRSTIVLGVAASALVTLVTLYNVPLHTRDGIIIRPPDDLLFGIWAAVLIGMIFIAGYAYRISREINVMSDALLATQMALLREQKLTDLGGVVAAAAHELGTPLATIKLVSSELVSELSDPELRDDALLIRDQTDRCRDILRSMGRAGKDDKYMRHAPLDTVVREAAEPHKDRGKTIVFSVMPADSGESQQPTIARLPEIIHGIRNLVQNAVDFAESRVWVDASWSADTITICISDDGRGFPSQVIGRLGDPFLRRRRTETDRTARPGYEGMGLGLFIAKTLLERTGARLTFTNGSDPFLSSDELPERSGANIFVIWPRDRIEKPAVGDASGIGVNEIIRV